MNLKSHQLVRLDLNNPVFQRQLFNLSKNEQRNILNTLRKLNIRLPVFYPTFLRFLSRMKP